MKKITVAEYLIQRLHECGIDNIFGVPGDYNLGLLDYVVKSPLVQWIGTCNELNASYAADGYARLNGMSAIITTYGVGELSAINGIAGAFAEHIPVVNIVGMAGLSVQQQHLYIHHNLDTQHYDTFLQMCKPVTVRQEMLTAENAAAQIDLALINCYRHKKPVYIGVPTDIVTVLIDAPQTPLQLSRPSTDFFVLKKAEELFASACNAAQDPIALVDAYAMRHQLLPNFIQLIEKYQWPFVTTAMGKGLIDETHPQFLGFYFGELSNATLRERVENSGCVIACGWFQSDLNTANFTANIQQKNFINIMADCIVVQKEEKIPLNGAEFLNTLLHSSLLKSRNNDTIYSHQNSIPFMPTSQKINLRRFWQAIEHFLKEDDIILAEMGTSLFGLLGIQLPKNTTVVSQIIWASIGYTLGALVGTSIAAAHRRQVLIIGDGSFQLTAQEISTLLRHKKTPIIFLVNNDGYTVERLIHGDKMLYNDIQPWKYHTLPQVFGSKVWSTVVNTEEELLQAIDQLSLHTDKLCFIEVTTDRMDAPELLYSIGTGAAKTNRY